jgi:hypothetical protein
MDKMLSYSKALLAIGAGCTALSFSLPVSAVEGRVGTVKACSAVMTGKCATGAVRNTAYGKQVQLPGGTWVDCAGDCSRKLRKQTVDFWQEQMLQN